MTRIGGNGPSLPPAPLAAKTAAPSSPATMASAKGSPAQAASRAPLASPQDSFERIGDGAAGGGKGQAAGIGNLFDRVGGPVKGGKSSTAAPPPKGRPAATPPATPGVWQAMKGAAGTVLEVVSETIPKAVGEAAVPKELERLHEKVFEQQKKVTDEIHRNIRG